MANAPYYSDVAMDAIAPQITSLTIETVSPEGTFCDTVQVPSRVGDMELI